MVAAAAPGVAGTDVSATTVANALAGEPEAVPSDGVTWTDTVSPASPLPARARSNVSVDEVELDVVLRTVVPTRHRYVTVTPSPSGSLFVTDAVTMALASGAD